SVGAMALAPSFARGSSAYGGPNVILVRFGGGVRRRETIESDHSYSPYLSRVLRAQGVLFPRMEISNIPGIVTSHGQGTLYLITGRYDKYEDIDQKPFSDRFAPKVPTVFEYLRKRFDAPAHQTLIVNGEDRTAEEFYTFSNHHLFGIDYRSHVLSLYRYKVWLLRRQIDEGRFEGDELAKAGLELAKMERVDYRQSERTGQGAVLDGFWERWREYYGQSGLVNARGDRLLTELALRGLAELKPRLMMINYQDPDYVHWGQAWHYTRAISIIDRGLEQLVAAVNADPHYRDNTVFVVVPDCGRDDNRFTRLAFQHHFNSRSAREIWALVFGSGVAQGIVVNDVVEQINVASTIGALMGFETPFAEGEPLHQVFS
ncbi:MAG: hypothetical protein V3U43_04395, partial [Pseudomonadales bacterium]